MFSHIRVSNTAIQLTTHNNREVRTQQQLFSYIQVPNTAVQLTTLSNREARHEVHTQQQLENDVYSYTSIYYGNSTNHTKSQQTPEHQTRHRTRK